MVNFNKTINDKLLIKFQNIDKQLESNIISDNQKKGSLIQKCKDMINNLNNYENTYNNLFPLSGNNQQKKKEKNQTRKMRKIMKRIIL